MTITHAIESGDIGTLVLTYQYSVIPTNDTLALWIG